MGLFNSEAEKREKRWTAEAEAQRAYHERKAREAELEAAMAQTEPTNEHDVEMERVRLENEHRKEDRKERKEQALESLAKSGRGDAFLDLLRKFNAIDDTSDDGETQMKQIASLIQSWRIPSDKKEFDAFVQALAENSEFIKKTEEKWNYHNFDDDDKSLRTMFIEKARKVARIRLKGQVDDSLALLQEVEDEISEEKRQEKEDDKKTLKWTIIGFIICVLLFALIAMLQELG